MLIDLNQNRYRMLDGWWHNMNWGIKHPACPSLQVQVSNDLRHGGNDKARILPRAREKPRPVGGVQRLI